MVDPPAFGDDFVNFELADSDGVFVGGGGALADDGAFGDGIADFLGVRVDGKKCGSWHEIGRAHV